MSDFFKKLENLVTSLKNDLIQTKEDTKIDSDFNINIMKNNLNEASNKLDTVKNYNNNSSNNTRNIPMEFENIDNSNQSQNLNYSNFNQNQINEEARMNHTNLLRTPDLGSLNVRFNNLRLNENSLLNPNNEHNFDSHSDEILGNNNYISPLKRNDNLSIINQNNTGINPNDLNNNIIKESKENFQQNINSNENNNNQNQNLITNNYNQRQNSYNYNNNKKELINQKQPQNQSFKKSYAGPKLINQQQANKSPGNFFNNNQNTNNNNETSRRGNQEQRISNQNIKQKSKSTERKQEFLGYDPKLNNTRVEIGLQQINITCNNSAPFVCACPIFFRNAQENEGAVLFVNNQNNNGIIFICPTDNEMKTHLVNMRFNSSQETIDYIKSQAINSYQKNNIIEKKASQLKNGVNSKILLNYKTLMESNNRGYNYDHGFNNQQIHDPAKGGNQHNGKKPLLKAEEISKNKLIINKHKKDYLDEH